MNSMVEPFVMEMQGEAKTTRRVLEKVPEAKLSWRPHPKALSLGQLALHIAKVPGGVAKILETDEFVPGPDAFQFAEAKSRAEIMAAFEESTKASEAFVGGLSESACRATWKLNAGGKTVMARPRIEVVRSVMMNHLYHHRGQLATYLKMLDVAVPSIYGPSGDENPFN